ncbi:MAG: efflux RND transporter periplasmic adaptor subunit [Rhodobacteraceae bacterium]|nr:efflux RND transporter periplasmic adaptor subunit [Paracoccaceae bacterium]
MNIKSLLLLPPLAIGIGGLMWMNSREAPLVEAAETAQLAVRVSTVAEAPVSVTATGYGRVVAATEWSAVSQVQGRVTELADGLSEGKIVEAGEVLVRVERTDYDLAVQRAKANVATAEASLQELDLQEVNTRRSLGVQQGILDLAKINLDRAEELLASGTGTRAAVENAQSAYLAQQSSVVNLQNTVDLVPVQRSAAEAALAAQRVALAEAETNLSRTTITAPFRGRIAASPVQKDQFIRTGESLLTLHDISAVEVTAEIQPQAFLPLAASVFGPNFMAGSDIDAARAIEVLTEAGVTATVGLEQASGTRSYRAQLVRFRGTVNAETGTIGFTVQVNDPLVANRQSGRLPLNVGAFVSVDLVAPARDGVIAIPRAILHRDDQGAPFVYVADDEDRLEIRPVTTGIVLDDRVTISQGLQTGDRLILSKPHPPIPGIDLILVPFSGEN